MNCFTDNTAAAAQMALVFRVHHAADMPARDAKLALLEAAMAAVAEPTEATLAVLMFEAEFIRDKLRSEAWLSMPTESEAEIAEIRRMGETK